MNAGSLFHRYARALLNLAAKAEQVDAVPGDRQLTGRDFPKRAG